VTAALPTAARRPGALHPREALFGVGQRLPGLPVCDHYAGVPERMRKSLALQAELGPVFDVTLDGEDGAPVGGEVEHAQLIAELVDSPLNAHGRVGARVVPVAHPAFLGMVEALVRRAGHRLAYLTVPKVEGLAELDAAARVIDHVATGAGVTRPIPLHALVETHGALREVQTLAAHPRIESLSFGLMDFVSAHRGAIPQSAMGASGQFEHPLVLRAKLAIAAACHATGRTPSHCVVTEFRQTDALRAAARRAARELGYTRMWSIHPAQIRPIVEAFAPAADEIEQAAEILGRAQAAHWAPIAWRDTLHDRASYRYFWQVLERAWRTAYAGGPQLPPALRQAWFEDA